MSQPSRRRRRSSKSRANLYCKLGSPAGRSAPAKAARLRAAAKGLRRAERAATAQGAACRWPGQEGGDTVTRESEGRSDRDLGVVRGQSDERGRTDARSAWLASRRRTRAAAGTHPSKARRRLCEEQTRSSVGVQLELLCTGRTELGDQDCPVAALRAEAARDTVLSQKLGRHLDREHDLRA